MHLHAAEGGELLVERYLLVGPGGPRRGYEGAGRDDFGGEDVGVLEGDLLEVGAAGLSGLGEGWSEEKRGGYECESAHVATTLSHGLSSSGESS
ncbi:MAG TPA: hypothetical protein VF133_02770 [Terriglobales bacterium]